MHKPLGYDESLGLPSMRDAGGPVPQSISCKSAGNSVCLLCFPLNIKDLTLV